MSKAFTIKKLKFFDRLVRDRNLKGMDPCVAWRLLDRISVEGKSCYPSLETVAAELGCNERTVRRSVDALEKKGWFHIKRGGGGRKKVHHYWPNYGNRTDLSTLGTKKTGHPCPSKPDKRVPENRTNVSRESSKESINQSRSGRVPPPLKGGAAPFRGSLGDASLDASTQGLQGEPGIKNPPHTETHNRFPSAERSPIQLLGEVVDCKVILAAHNPAAENHESAVEECKRKARLHEIPWSP